MPPPADQETPPTPSEVRTSPELPGANKVGAPLPLPTMIYPAPSTPVFVIALVPFPRRIAPAVCDEAPVPP